MVFLSIYLSLPSAPSLVILMHAAHLCEHRLQHVICAAQPAQRSTRSAANHALRHHRHLVS